MPARNWLSAIAPVGVVLIAVLMLLATGLVNRQNEVECASGGTAPGCVEAAQPGGFAVLAAPDAAAREDIQGLQAPAWWDASLLAAAPFSPYLPAAGLVLIALTLVVALVVARRQRRLELVQRGTDDGKAVTTERIITLVETVVSVIRAMEGRTRELDASVKALGATRSAQHQELAERLASAVAELGTYQKTLTDEFVPSVARRDERLVAIDANLTAITDRLARLGADAEHNARETAALGERFRTLVQSVAELTSGLVELRRSLQDSPERPSGAAAAGPSQAADAGPSQAAAATVGSDQSPASDGGQASGAGSAHATPSDEAKASDTPSGQPAGDA